MEAEQTRHNYTLLVNSTDSFEDCWQPFFTLLREFWPEPRPRIVLNTETKSFTFPGLDIICSQVGLSSHQRSLTWSESLAECLDQIECDVVLYLQEDYFISGPVRVDIIDRLARLMRAHDIACVRVMECGGAGPWSSSEFPGLWTVDRHAKYRISLQAGLWQKHILRSYLRKHENAWQLEMSGSRRAARRRGDRILCVDRDAYAAREAQVIPYTPTGIVKGKWNEAAVAGLFAAHDISVDFSVRGVYTPGSAHPASASVWARLLNRLRSAV